MDATDRLCRMLDERGIEYVSIGGITNWEHAEYDELADGSDTRLIVLGATPEQAINATVGGSDVSALRAKVKAQSDYIGKLCGEYKALDEQMERRCAEYRATIRKLKAELDTATVGAGTCRYIPDDAGFTWWDENDVEHYEEHSASDECCSASCDKCGNQMMVGEEGWFNGWDEITEWWEEDGSYHKGYVLEPRFKHCPNCGRKVIGTKEVAE